MRRLIIADIKSFNNYGVQTGHYFSVARNYQELFRCDIEVKIAGGPIYKTGFNEDELLLLPYDYQAGDSEIKNKLRVIKNYKFLINHTTPDDVIVIQMSGASTVFLAMGVFPHIGKRTIYSIQYDNEVIDSKIKRLIYSIAKKRVKGFICPSEQIAQKYEKPYCVVSDYICSSDYCEQSLLSYEEKEYDFLFIGRIVPEKGIPEALEFLVTQKCKVLVAGRPVNAEIENRIRDVVGTNPNFDLRLGFVDRSDYYQYIRKSRYCFLNYGGVYLNRSSGVVLDSIFNGTPVLANRCHAMKFIEEMGVGSLFGELQEIDIKRLLSVETYTQYLRSIPVFCERNKREKEILSSFIFG